MPFLIASLFLGLLPFVRGEVHQLIVGTFTTKNLYTVEFDDTALTLSLVKNLTVPAAAAWIALSHDKQNLYGTDFTDSVPYFTSYSIGNATDIAYDTSVAVGNCLSARTIYVVGSTEPPYNVYGTVFGECGSVLSVNENGSLSGLIQNYTYSSGSGVHGLALDASNSFLYSADDTGNALWTHSIDAITGELSLVGSVSGPVSGSDPRHVAIHPEHQYLYVIFEGTNKLAQYSIDSTTGLPIFNNITFPLIPTNATSSSYWSDEVAISSSGEYLWATSRARQSSSTGYISAFSLAADGSIIKQLFLVPTTSSGGSANSVAPSEFSDRFVALTDSSSGFVEIWSLVSNKSSASVVAHLDLDDGGCCANAVWYS